MTIVAPVEEQPDSTSEDIVDRPRRPRWSAWAVFWAAWTAGVLASFGTVVLPLRIVGAALGVVAVAKAKTRSAPIAGFLVVGLAATGSDPSPDGSAGRILLYLAAAVVGAGIAWTANRLEATMSRVALGGFALVVLLVGSLPGPSLQASGPSAAELEGRQLDPEVAAELDQWIRDELRGIRAPGFAVSIVSRDDVLFERAYGVAGSDRKALEPDTPVVLASVSKSFTGLAIAKLAHEGRLELDAPVRTYLPEFRIADEEASARITVRDTVNQTSGLDTVDGINSVGRDESLEEAVSRMAGAQTWTEPGTDFRYTNLNLQIAGRVVEVVSGRSFAEYLRDEVLAPIGMARTTAFADAADADLERASGYATMFGLLPRVHDRGVPTGSVPAGGVSASIHDLGSYLRFQLNQGSVDGNEVISPDAMRVVQEPPGGWGADEDVDVYNMGWKLDEDDVWGRQVAHGGAWTNTSTGVVFYPEADLGIALISPHMSLASAPTSGMREGVFSILRGEDPPAPGRGYAVTYVLVLLVLGTFAALAIRALGHVPGWSARSTRPRWLRITWVAISHIALPLLILIGFPASYGVPWSLQMRFLPDLVLAILLLSVLFIGAGVVKIARSTRNAPEAVQA